MDNFNLRKYLTENKLTAVSRLMESEEPNFNDPTAICRLDFTGDQVVGQGEGFDVAEIAKALEKGYELQMEQSRQRNRHDGYAYFDWENNPDVNGVGLLYVNPEGSYGDHYGEERQCDTFESGAQKFQKVLTNCSPKELNNHVKGWIVVHSPRYRSGIYPMLDPEGVRIYLEAEDRLTKAISSYYGHGGYCGD